jgi:hypothetical protein
MPVYFVVVLSPALQVPLPEQQAPLQSSVQGVCPQDLQVPVVQELSLWEVLSLLPQQSPPVVSVVQLLSDAPQEPPLVQELPSHPLPPHPLPPQVFDPPDRDKPQPPEEDFFAAFFFAAFCFSMAASAFACFCPTMAQVAIDAEKATAKTKTSDRTTTAMRFGFFFGVFGIVSGVLFSFSSIAKALSLCKVHTKSVSRCP